MKSWFNVILALMVISFAAPAKADWSCTYYTAVGTVQERFYSADGFSLKYASWIAFRKCANRRGPNECRGFSFQCNGDDSSSSPGWTCFHYKAKGTPQEDSYSGWSSTREKATAIALQRCESRWSARTCGSLRFETHCSGRD